MYFSRPLVPRVTSTLPPEAPPLLLTEILKPIDLDVYLPEPLPKAFIYGLQMHSFRLSCLLVGDLFQFLVDKIINWPRENNQVLTLLLGNI